MANSVCDWLGSLLEHGVLAFERRSLEASAPQMTGETPLTMMEYAYSQGDWIEDKNASQWRVTNDV